MEKVLSAEEVAVKFNNYREIVAGFADLLSVENQALRDYDVEKVEFSLLPEETKFNVNAVNKYLTIE